MEKLYNVSCYNFSTRRNEICVHNLTKEKGEELVEELKKFGAKNVKLVEVKTEV